jgi:hypothetical protein
MNKKPPVLPNIEDATLRACLAPLMEAMHPGVETAAPLPQAFVPNGAPAMRSSDVAQGPAGSNDNPVPSADAIVVRDRECAGVPKTLAEWRTLADDDFGVFRMIEHFLGMTDTELEAAAAEFPKQISGTVARITRMKRRLAARYDTVTTVSALLERAMARAAAAKATEEPATRLPLTGD